MSFANLDDIQHDILLNEALLASLEDDDSEESKRDSIAIKEKLRDLNSQLQSLFAVPDWGTAQGSMDPNWHKSYDTGSSGVSLNHRPGSSSSADNPSRLTPSSDSSNMAPPSTFLSLPSRKRLRNASYDDDLLDLPDSKSFRPSPAVSAPRSPTSTVDSFDFDDDPEIQRLLGQNIKDDILANRKALAELEKKRKQEEEDAEFARQLEEMENMQRPSLGPSASSFVTSHRYPQTSTALHRPATTTYTQAIFSPGGSSFRARPPPVPARPIKSEFLGNTSHAGSYSFGGSNSYPLQSSDLAPFASGGPSTPAAFSDTINLLDQFNSRHPDRTPQNPVSPTESDSEIEEISAIDFNPNWRQPQQQRQQQQSMYNDYGRQNTRQSQYNPLASLETMPGAFPSASSLFAGNSVYGNNFSPDFFSLIDDAMASLGYPANSIMAGSSTNPLDVDAILPSLRDYYSDPSKTQEEIRELIKHIRPDEELNPADREGTPEQIKFPLMEHQKLGLAWMKKMEEGTNKGGILADDMGLGKTIQALALIVSRPPPPDVHRPTLVVAPVALMEQWKREAEKMIKPQHALKVFVLHGNQRQTAWKVLKRYDLILTTFGQLASDLKRKLAWEEKLKTYPDERPTITESYPILGEKSVFHRVILDEAQWIKNKATKSAIAACHIQSEYRWCMTGTPMQNSVEELYSLVKFCRIKPYNEDAKFSRDFTRPLKKTYKAGKERAMTQLQAFLKAILLRRTKTSTIDGKPILTLPPKTTVESRAVFSDDERDFYKALEGKAQLQFNKYLKAGTVGRNYSNVLVLLLRLRQACCHPHLIKDFAIHTGASMEGVDLLENARSLPKDVVERIKQNGDAFECPVCLDAAENPVIFNPCGHALCNECLARLVEGITQAGEAGDPTCPHCRAKINTAKVTDHASFLRIFDPENASIQNDDPVEAESEADSSDETESDDDDDDGEDLKDFIVDDDADVEDDLESDGSDGEAYESDSASTPFEKSAIGKAASLSKKAKGKMPAKKSKNPRKTKESKKVDHHKSLAQLRREGLKNKSAKKRYLKRLKKSWQTSAKIEKTLELLEAIHALGRGEKTIIFSGFTSFLDLLEVPLHNHPDLQIYARYDGSMPPKSRNEAVLEFTSNPHCKLMLVSLKAGNAGLNLTAANHVIILDPHWNPFVEMQAADRAYRIGQMREVTVHRVLIDGQNMDTDDNGTATVEDRILALQEKKRQLVDSALDENAGNSVARLGVRELGYLFGVNSMNESD